MQFGYEAMTSLDEARRYEAYCRARDEGVTGELALQRAAKIEAYLKFGTSTDKESDNTT